MRQRNGRVPLLIMASLTGAVVSAGSGMLIGEYAVSGINPVYDARPWSDRAPPVAAAPASEMIVVDRDAEARPVQLAAFDPDDVAR